MSTVRPVIGVVGATDCSEELKKSAFAVGQVLAEAGAIVLTGGHPFVRESSVKFRALVGALDYAMQYPSKGVGIIGIMPANYERKREHRKQLAEANVSCLDSTEPHIGTEDPSKAPKNCRWLFLHSQTPSEVRNPLNGQIPDVIIALEGGATGGTLSEVAFAAHAKRPIVFLDPHGRIAYTSGAGEMSKRICRSWQSPGINHYGNTVEAALKAVLASKTAIATAESAVHEALSLATAATGACPETGPFQRVASDFNLRLGSLRRQ